MASTSRLASDLARFNAGFHADFYFRDSRQIAKIVNYEARKNSHIDLVHTADLHAFPAMLAQPRSMQQHRVRAARAKAISGRADFLFANFQNDPISINQHVT